MRGRSTASQAKVSTASCNGEGNPAARLREFLHPMWTETLNAFKASVLDLDRAVRASAASHERAAARLRDTFERLHDATQACFPFTSANPHILDALERELLPYVALSRIADRAYSKPRGYAGDYLTIDHIYRSTPAGVGRVGRYIDECFLNTPASRAVRNRRGLMVRELLHAVGEGGSTPVRIMSIGSGPARELLDVVETSGIDEGAARFTLVDLDDEALAFVRRQAEEGGVLWACGEFVKANVVVAALRGRSLTNEPQDLVYSIGLTDYLSDGLCVKLLDLIHRHLRPGGRVIIGNFHPNNPSRAVMDHVLDWKLVHRTEADLNRLFERSAFGRPCTRMMLEKEGVNVFGECVK